MPFNTWIILATPGIFSSNPLFHLNLLTDQQDLPQPQQNCNSHCLKDLCKNICFSEKNQFSISFFFLFTKLCQGPRIHPWWGVKCRIFEACKNKEPLNPTAAAFQPWKVPNKHELEMFFIIFLSLWWVAGLACPREVRKWRGVREKPLFVRGSVSGLR